MKRVINPITNLTSDSKELLTHNVVFLTGTLIISILNYLYYPVIGHVVSIEVFGEVQAMLSIFMQLGIVLTAFGYVVTNLTNNSSDPKNIAQLVFRLEVIVLVCALALFIVLAGTGFYLKSFLHFTSMTPILLLGLLLAVNVPTTSRMFMLQGLRRLKEVSMAGVIFAATKLLFSLILIYLGLSVSAVVIGYILAQILTLIYLLPRTNHIMPLKYMKWFSLKGSIQNGLIRQELYYGLAILVLLSGIMLLFSSDTIIVRIYFSPLVSGYYSSISSIARIVFFVTASVAGVLLATAKINQSYSNNLKVLFKSFGLVTVIGGVIVALFSIFPHLVVRLLFGRQYLTDSYLLPLLSVVMLFCAYNNLLVAFEISLRRFKAIYIVIFGILIGFGSIIVFHKTLTEVILGYLAANVVIFMLLSVHIVKRKQHAETITLDSAA